MQFLRHLPIKSKLMVIAMLVSSTALLVACGAFIVYEQAAARKQMVQALNITAAMTAANSTAGLSFNEAGSVEQALKSLSFQPDIVQACVYDKDGRMFARFLRADAMTNSPPPPIANAGCRFDRHRLELFQSINLAGEPIGTIYLEQDLSQLTARLWRYFLIGILVLLLSAGVAFFLSARLQKIISEPLSDLTRTVAAVRAEKNYSARAAKQGDDELGSLIDGFNDMLAQIQERDAHLERRVAERTQALAESLSVLNATLGSTADGILVVNAQGKKIFQNRRTMELWKIPPAIAGNDDDTQQVRHVVNAVIDPDKLAEQIAYFYAHPAASGQDEVQLKDGTILERITAPVLDQNGRNYGRIWTFRDVTQSRKYEAALRESQARFKFIFESVPVGIVSHRVHPDGRIIREINDAQLRICGLTREEHDIPGIYAKLIHPEDRARQQEFMGQVNAGSRDQFLMEKRYLRPDGTTVWVVFSYQRQHYADGGFEELTTLVDITESKRAEAAVLESESLLRSIMENSQEVIFVKDLECRFLYMNPAGYRLSGMTPEKLLGRSKADFHRNAAETAKFMADDRRVMESTLVECIEEEINATDGTKHVFLTTKVARRDSQGKVNGLIGVAHDITDRKRAEEALRESEANYYSLVDQMPAGIFRKDKEGRYVFVNSWFCRFKGVKPEDYLGKLPVEVGCETGTPEGAHGRSAILAAADLEHHRAIMGTGRTIEFDEESIGPDGKVSHIHAIKSPVFGPDSSVVGSQGILLDITEHKLAEAELAYERHLLRTLLENSTDHIYFKDTQSRFIKSSNSQARQFGVASAAELVGKSDFDFFTEEHARPAFEDEQQIIRTGQPMIGKVETEFWKDGRAQSWVLTTKMPLRDKAGEIIGTFGISKDITPLKQAEAQIEKAHQELLETSRQAGMAEVATSVLHNVGNVLNSVNVSTTLVLDLVKKSRLSSLGRLAAMINEHQNNLAEFFTTDPRGMQLPAYLTKLAEHLAAEQASLVAEIELTRTNIEHIKDIVTMQQNYARVSGVVEKVKVTDLVDDALRMNAGALNRHNVQVVRDYPAEAIECNVERQKVLQVLVNLIRNAKYACDDSGRPDKRLVMQVRVAGSRAQISVLDNGVGIPAENMTRIFNHGFTTRAHGHGFGLHSGALAAKELGGSLAAYSDGPGTGARFVLDLPLQPPPKA